MQLHRPIREQHKRRRSHSRLRHIKNPHPLAHRNRRAFKINRPDEAVHLSSSNALPPLGRHLLDHWKNLLRPLAVVRRNKQHRSIRQKFQPIPQSLFIKRAVLRTLGILNPRRLRLADRPLLSARDQVPLIYQNDHRPSALVGVARDIRVQSAGALGRIDHEEHNVGVFNILARHYHRQLLGHQVCLALAPDARRIHKPNRAPLIPDHLINRIPRCARNRRDNGAVLPRKLIQQSRLPDIRMPDNRHLDLMRLLGDWFCAFLRVLSTLRVKGFDVGNHLENGVEQIVNPPPMLRRNRKYVPHPQRMKLPQQRILLV